MYPPIVSNSQIAEIHNTFALETAPITTDGTLQDQKKKRAFYCLPTGKKSSQNRLDYAVPPFSSNHRIQDKTDFSYF